MLMWLQVVVSDGLAFVARDLNRACGGEGGAQAAQGPRVGAQSLCLHQRLAEDFTWCQGCPDHSAWSSPEPGHFALVWGCRPEQLLHFRFGSVVVLQQIGSVSATTLEAGLARLYLLLGNYRGVARG